jgi:hypothetical protein
MENGMNSALHKASGEVVTAKEACYRHFTRTPGYEKADNFVCEACRVTVRCINFGKAEEDMQVRPAFSTRWSTEGNHLADCPYKLGELVEDLLLEQEGKEYRYTPGPITFTLGVALRKTSSIRYSTPSANPSPLEGEAVTHKKKRRARQRMEDLLWLPESYFEMIRHHPNVQIKTPKGTFFSQEYLKPVNEVDWQRGHGVLYGKARLWPREGAKGMFYVVEMVEPDKDKNKIQGNLFPDRFEDDEKLQKVLARLQKRPYHVAFWWTDVKVPDQTRYTNIQTAQMWVNIKRVAIKEV